MILDEFLSKYTVQPEERGKDFVSIRGCGGSGKSTFIYEMMNHDPETFEVTWTLGGKSRIILTCIPNFNFVAVGAYKNRKCGGGDTVNSRDYDGLGFNTTADVVYKIVETVSVTKFNIIFEGLLASTIYETYKNIFEKIEKLGRTVHIITMDAPVEVCYDRILSRNGGKEVSKNNVANKWGSVHRSHKKFEDNTDFHCVLLDNSQFDKDLTLPKYYEAIGLSLPENYQNNFDIKEEDWDW